MCPPLKFKVDATGITSLLAKATHEGQDISGDIGRASGHTPVGDVTITWNYNRPASELTIQCVSKPFIASCSLINTHVADAIGLKPE